MLFESRISSNKVYNYDGNKVIASAFDIKTWKDHDDFKYSQTTTTDFPASREAKKVKKVGWDLGHARRYVYFMNTVESNRNILSDVTFPDTSIIYQLSNQFVYVVFNGMHHAPLFTNYFDGSNGWYRVNYHGAGFGYGPYDLTHSALTGGFLMWGDYNKDIELLKYAMYNFMTTRESEISNHRKYYYGRIYKAYKKTDAVNYSSREQELFWLQFLPTVLY
jgi:hypothetical protein